LLIGSSEAIAISARVWAYVCNDGSDIVTKLDSLFHISVD